MPKVLAYLFLTAMSLTTPFMSHARATALATWDDRGLLDMDVVDGITYTDPTYGFSVSWDPERFEYQIGGLGGPEWITLRRTGTREIGSISISDASPDHCLNHLTTMMRTSVYIDDFAPANDIVGPETSIEGSSSGTFRYESRAMFAGNPGTHWVAFYLCVPIPNHPNRSIFVTFMTSESLYPSTRTGWQAIVGSITFADETGATSESGE